MTDFITEQTPLQQSRQRAYDPARGDPSRDTLSSTISTLFDDCMGDWSWKPLRDRALGKNMVTFLGVPPSGAEMFRGRHA